MFSKIGISKKSSMLAYVIFTSLVVLTVAIVAVASVTMVAPEQATMFIEFARAALMWFATIATGGTFAYQFAQSSSERSPAYIHPEFRDGDDDEPQPMPTQAPPIQTPQQAQVAPPPSFHNGRF